MAAIRGRSMLAIVGLMMAAGPARAGGWITGDTGGNERDAALFDRGRGMIWYKITAPDGRFLSPELPAGEYMALSSGHVARVAVRDGRRSEIAWAGQPGYEADTETWSPGRTSFGQTFVAFAPWIASVTLWIPGADVELAIELREDGPAGKVVARRNLAASWVCGPHLSLGEWPTQPGKKYYLGLTSKSGRPFSLGTPAIGEAYADGEAYYDDTPMLDSDLGLIIRGDNEGLIATLLPGKGLGFKSEGPAAGLCTWAAQEFVAVTRNVVTAYANAGWGGQEGIKKEFVFSIHRESPAGEQVGPARTAEMVKDWGTTAVWFPDQVPLEPGRKYVLKFARVDGKPFYAYLAEDAYKPGRAIRAEMETPDLDLTCDIRGELHPGGVHFPYNVGAVRIEREQAIIAWETGVPTRGDVLYRLPDAAWTACAEEGGFKIEHTVTLKGLTPGVTYEYAVQGRTDVQGAALMRSKMHKFGTLPDSTRPPTELKDLLPPGARPVELVNPGFEDDLKGWSLSRPPREEYAEQLPAVVGHLESYTDLQRFLPHGGGKVCGWYHDVTSKSGVVPRKLEPALDQTVWQRVRVEKGGHYILSAWLLTDQVKGGWNRNDRIRLCVDAAGAGRLADPKIVDDRGVTQWYTTGGRWLKRRLAFTAQSDQVDIGLQFHQWWMLKENYLYADDVQLLRAEP